MTENSKYWPAALAVLAGAWLAAPHAAFADTDRPSAAQRYTAADRRAAAALNTAGDRAYRAGEFGQALRSYMNAYPNFPNAHAYLMSGDTHWRAVLSASRAAQDAAPPRCGLPNAHFASDVRRSLEQHFHPGLSMPQAASDSGLRERAMRTAACLGELAKRHEALPASSCVEVDALSACLGAPWLQ